MNKHKSGSSRRWLLLLIALPLGCAAYFAHSARPLLFPYRAHVTEAARQDAKRRLPQLEDVAWQTGDGLTLRGWFSPGARQDAIIFVHGLTGNRTQFLAEAEFLSKRDHGVLVYDSRASGESDGKLATWGDRERLDIKGAVDFLLTRKDVRQGGVGLFGCSVGGSAAALAGAEDQRIHAVLLGPTWPSLDAELHQDFKQLGAFSGWAMLTTFNLAGVNVDAIRPVDVVRTIAPRPLLMLSGSEDTDTPPAIMQALQGAAPGAERWVVPGAGHCDYVRVSPVEYVRRVSDFFDSAFGAR